MLRRILLALLLLVALFATACGGGGDDAADSENDDSESHEDDSDSADDGDDAGEPDDDTSTTTEVPMSPPTTRGPAPVLEVNPVAGVGSIVVLTGHPAYRGLLAQLDPDRNLVQAVALPPADVAPGFAPLTGLPLADDEVAERPAIVVKIDNTEKGRPQEALSLADIVYVTEIEGGFTRLAAVYHSHTPPEFGPIRSGRTSDIGVFSSFNEPIFVYSGANQVHQALIQRYETVNLGALTRSEYYRADDRPGTYDLMTDPSVMWGIAADQERGGTPPVHFEYRDDTVGLPPTAVPASEIRIDYASVGIDYAWDDALGVWRRMQSGTPYVDADELEVRPVNVVVAEVARLSTGMVDTAGSPVGEQQFVGSGRGWVFTDGHAIEVTWTKPSLSSVATWTTPDGVPVPLTPGQTWIELTPAGASSFS